MKQAEDTKTAELPGLKKRGRPSTGNAMTNAQRQQAYRRRQQHERYRADASEVSRVTLIQQLNDALMSLDNPEYPYREGAEYTAQQVIGEIVTRYALDLRKIKAQRVTK